ncbi:hypothetical protein KL921_002791 [Ogataea angusta]|nr:hypothetical protein KL921_002791 [Ogataea angusta]
MRIFAPLRSGQLNFLASRQPRFPGPDSPRKANLGTIIQMLQLKVPHLLQHNLPQEFLSQDIVLRLLPAQRPHIPVIRGVLLYNTTFKTLQLLVTSFFLNPEAKLHITHMNIKEARQSLSNTDLVNLSINNNLLDFEESPELSPYTTKITIKWRTCLNGCLHLHDNKTADARLGAYNLDTNSLLHLKLPLQNLTKLNDNSIERVLTGIFVFELTDKNDKIAVHTIDDCEIIENEQPSPDTNNIGFAPGA